MTTFNQLPGYHPSLFRPGYLERRQNAVVVLGVLSHPRVGVVDVRPVDILVGHLGQHHEPLLQKLRPEGEDGGWSSSVITTRQTNIATGRVNNTSQ